MECFFEYKVSQHVQQHLLLHYFWTSCDTTTAKGQLSWLRRNKRIKHTGEASPGAPRSRILFQELFHRNMPWCRDMSESLNKFRELVHYGTAGPPIWSMVSSTAQSPAQDVNICILWRTICHLLLDGWKDLSYPSWLLHELPASRKPGVNKDQPWSHVSQA